MKKIFLVLVLACVVFGCGKDDAQKNETFILYDYAIFADGRWFCVEGSAEIEFCKFGEKNKNNNGSLIFSSFQERDNDCNEYGVSFGDFNERIFSYIRTENTIYIDTIFRTAIFGSIFSGEYEMLWKEKKLNLISSNSKIVLMKKKN